MSSEMRLINGDILERQDSIARIKLKDSIDKQKRIPMGQMGQDGPNVHRRNLRCGGWGRIGCRINVHSGSLHGLNQRRGLNLGQSLGQGCG
jgi:hypothetical protein